ncbi:MAG: asparagine synthase (glutamine-hydrolyzing) [Defluviitaleaceae bacterium]|nr:asparagine synthase (glutamine-hydrolyzing) [Defluviitaleaceae bacterium]
MEIFFSDKNFSLSANFVNMADNGGPENILGLYRSRGADMPSLLRGGFSLAVIDNAGGKIFCARDRFGIVPFYYAQIDGNFSYGTSLKKIVGDPNFNAELNEEALHYYLFFQYSALPETFFKGVFKLPPAHYLVYENGNVSIKRYWRASFNSSAREFEQAADTIDAAVRGAAGRCMLSGNDTGAFLSGGVDSSYAAACAGVKKVFTVGFGSAGYDETENAASLAKHIGAEHIAYQISSEEFFSSLHDVQFHMEEPLADPAAVAQFILCRETAKHVPAVISGEGADELFGGYNIYMEPFSLRKYAKLPRRLRKAVGKLAAKCPFNIKGKNFLIRGGKSVEERYIGNANIFTTEEANNILLSGTDAYPQKLTRQIYSLEPNADDVTKMQLLDISMWMADDILINAFKMSGAHSLLLHTPYLDDAVYDAAAALPTRFRVSKNETKTAFRHAAAKILPSATAARKKLGFPVPIRVWLREEKNYLFAKKYFTGETAKKYFKENILMDLLDGHFNGKRDNSRKIWTILTFLIWHEVFLNENNKPWN